jgi:hypothetical protein
MSSCASAESVGTAVCQEEARRAIDLLPRSRLAGLVGHSVPLDDLAPSKPTAASLLGEVKRFHAESLAGKHYESFAVNSKNFMDKSLGTERFIGEFDRLVTRCTGAASTGPRGPVREAFELLLALLRHVDACEDDVIFFADEGGSWQVGVDWNNVLPAYFRCLAETTRPDDFARDVGAAIKDFAEYARPSLLAEARRFASEEQKAAVLATRVVRWLLAASSRAAIGVMDPSEDGHLDDPAVDVGGPSGARRDLLRETLVGALRVEVAPVLGKHALEVMVAEDEDVVETLAPDTAKEALADRVRRWRADGGPNHRV